MYNRKRQVEDVELESSPVWTCTNENCKGWMRENFVTEDEPTCRLCESPMIHDTKMLPVLTNSHRDHKAAKKDEHA